MDQNQHFCLRWNNHQNTVLSVFANLLDNETFVDCTLATEGKIIKAHKLVLSACSPYFATLLLQHCDKHPIFLLKDIKYEELKAIVNYMYHGEMNISQEELAGLLKAAESLEIKGLTYNRTKNQEEHMLDADDNTLQQTKRSRIERSSSDSQNVYGSQENSPRRSKKARRRITNNISAANKKDLSSPEFSETVAATMALPIIGNEFDGTLPRTTENNLVGNQDNISASRVIPATSTTNNSTGTITAANSFSGTVPTNIHTIASFLAASSVQKQQTSETTRLENNKTANVNKEIEKTEEIKASTSTANANFNEKNAAVEENKETYLIGPTYHQNHGRTTSTTGKDEINLKSESEGLEDSDNNPGPCHNGNEKSGQCQEVKIQHPLKQSTTTNDGRLPCTVCGKSYLRKRHLQRHMRDECIGIPPRFKCEICPARFRRNYHMVRHMTSKHSIAPPTDGPENLSMKKIDYENKYFPESRKYTTSTADKTALLATMPPMMPAYGQPEPYTTYTASLPANTAAASAYSGSDEENKHQNNNTTQINIKNEPISPPKLPLAINEDWKMKLRLQLISNSILKERLMNSMPFAYNT